MSYRINNKSILRKNIRLKRDAQVLSEINRKSRIIIEKLISTDEYRRAKFIFVYVSFGSEVNTCEFIKKALKSGKRVGIPLTDIKKREMICSEIKDFEMELEPKTFGILEPRNEHIRKVGIDKIDLVIVPCVAFDRKCFRVGYGGGFYDRFLKKLKPYVSTIGLAYELQIIDSISIDEHDMPLNVVITEENVYKRES